jgi:hypothetical protein
MAKKARRKLDEDESPAFQFPEFDVRTFLTHEYEQTYATAIVIVLAVLLALLAVALDSILNGTGLATLVPLVLGVAIVAFTPFLILRLRGPAKQYTKGDWAGLILTEVFGFLGLWFLLLNVFHV